MMSEKPELTDIPGLGPKMAEKLIEANIKTVAKLSKSAPDKLAAKISGLSEASAAKLIDAAKELVSSAPAEKPKPKAKPKKKAEEAPVKPKKKPKVEEKPKPKKAKPKTEKKPKAKPKKKKEVKQVQARDQLHDARMLRIAREKRRRQPKFRHEQAHRWKRVSDSWRKVRGIDSATREKRKGRVAMVSSGYRKPRSVRGVHPSRYIEVHVNRPADLEGLDGEIHAIRIGSTVGLKKRQDILKKADSMLLRVLNPGAPEVLEEEELFTDLGDLEVD
ncbi:MAG: 50S ribosomal protein L32e [Candidatus Hodarchaeota archaeon]